MANNEVTSMLYSFIFNGFCLFSGNSHDDPKKRKLIIYSKNNNYLWINKAYKDDKTIALAKAYDLHPVVPSKKNRKSLWLYDKQLYK